MTNIINSNKISSFRKNERGAQNDKTTFASTSVHTKMDTEPSFENPIRTERRAIATDRYHAHNPLDEDIGFFQPSYAPSLKGTSNDGPHTGGCIDLMTKETLLKESSKFGSLKKQRGRKLFDGSKVSKSVNFDVVNKSYDYQDIQRIMKKSIANSS